MPEVSRGPGALALFEQVVEAAPNALVLVDQRGAIAIVNRETERLFGYDRAELIGRKVELLVPERSRAAHVEQRGQYLAHPSARAMGAGRDLYGVRKDGVEVPVEIGLRPLETEETTYVVAAIVDIRERKRAERESQRYVRDLQRMNQDLEDFAYVASHDLRSPLRAIENLAGWVCEDADELPGDCQEHLRKMQQRIRRMHVLLDDLLAYSRAGRRHGEYDLTDPNAVVEDVVALLDVPPGFTVEIAPGMPTLRTFRTPLETCLRNLLSNAIQHHDRPDGNVRVSCGERGEFLVFRVTDDGPGIDPRYHDRVFKVFQTLAPSNDKESSGIGLAIVKRTAESYGGSVEIDSRPGEGATFLLRWPRDVRATGFFE